MTKDELIALNSVFDKSKSISTLKLMVGKLITQTETITALIDDEIKPDGEFDEDIVKMFIDPDEIVIGEEMIESINNIIELMQPLRVVNNIDLLFPEEEEEVES